MDKREVIDRFEGKYFFLSNFYPHKMTIGGITYPTMEHYFQAQKTEDERIKRKIASAPTPGKAKQMGRRVKLRRDWEDAKLIIMYGGLMEKFKDDSLRQKLISTAPAMLVEGNWWHDNCWGRCYCDKCKGNKEIGEDKTNRLGRVLMVVRDGLIRELARKKGSGYNV